MRMRPAPAAALIATVVIAAGCGGPSAATRAFTRAYAAERSSVNRVGVALASSLQGAVTATDGQVASRLELLDSQLAAELGRLGALHPPSALHADAAAVQGALGTLEVDLRRLAAAVRDGSRATVEALAAELVRDATAVRRASIGLDRRLGVAPAPDVSAPPP